VPINERDFAGWVDFVISSADHPLKHDERMHVLDEVCACMVDWVGAGDPAEEKMLFGSTHRRAAFAQSCFKVLEEHLRKGETKSKDKHKQALRVIAKHTASANAAVLKE
jgi:hypothetical protein